METIEQAIRQNNPIMCVAVVRKCSSYEISTEIDAILDAINRREFLSAVHLMREMVVRQNHNLPNSNSSFTEC